MTNEQIGRCLLAYARSLPRETNLYRQRAFRQAALFVQGLDEPVVEILKRRGRLGLAAVPGIGEHLAYTIEMLVSTGQIVPWRERRHAAVA